MEALIKSKELGVQDDNEVSEDSDDGKQYAKKVKKELSKTRD